jgi:hypothetical protein
MAVPNVPATAASHLAEREWDKLINIILEGCVVPVVGSEALRAVCDGREQLLYDVWGQVLAAQAGLTATEDAGAPALYQVTNRLSQTQNSNDLAYDIDDVIRRKPWPIPESLRKLAQIANFQLYVTTTIDHLLKAALEEARPDQRGQVQDVVFTPRGVKTRIDLPEDFGYTNAPAVFHLFGASSSVEGTFAKTEDDLIEFSWSLLDHQYAPERLYDYLQKKTVLLLGCNFPDWLGRFLIHALNAGRHEETINIYYVSAGREGGLEEYLRRRRARVLVSPPLAFVEELHQRWQAKAQSGRQQSGVAGRSSAPPAFKRGAVFLSYASEDRRAVKRIRAQLEDANIDTWMDDSDLEPGEEFQQVIRDNIRDASFFIPVISRSLNSSSLPRYLWKEWKWAEDANLERRKEDRFLQPLAIDDTPPGAEFIDRPYRDLHWAKLRDGTLPDDFIQSLAQGIRRFRRPK